MNALTRKVDLQSQDGDGTEETGAGEGSGLGGTSGGDRRGLRGLSAGLSGDGSDTAGGVGSGGLLSGGVGVVGGRDNSRVDRSLSGVDGSLSRGSTIERKLASRSPQEPSSTLTRSCR